jgi:hypothetical protein
MIDVSRGNANAASYVDSLSDAAISIVTARELIVGARDKREAASIDALIATYAIEHVDTAVGVLASELLKRHAKIGRPSHV